MKPVDQKLPYDCFRAALASLLEVPIETLPTIHGASPGHWALFWDACEEWLRERGLHAVEVLYEDREAPDAWCIITGGSPRDSNQQHAVVGYGNQIKHDPNGSNDGLLGTSLEWTYMYIVPIDPTKGVTLDA